MPTPPRSHRSHRSHSTDSAGCTYNACHSPPLSETLSEPLAEPLADPLGHPLGHPLGEPQWEDPWTRAAKEAEEGWKVGEQVYTFSEEHIPCILDEMITNYVPLRTRNQKMVPADVIFLSMRFAYYYGTKDMLEALVRGTLERVRRISRSGDMVILGFWMSSCTLLMYYIKREEELWVAMMDFQLELSELIQEIYQAFIQESKGRLAEHLEASMMGYETIATLERLTFENEWRFFRRQKKAAADAGFIHEKHVTPSPLLITILLSSIFFILDVYHVHPTILKQAISQIFYWLSMELFNRIITKKTCLSRSKAMDIRFNISVIEDWARMDTFQFESQINAKSSKSEHKFFSMYDCLRSHMEPLIQLLQWLQCVTSLDDIQNVQTTVETLNLLTSTQLLYVAKNYRLEVDENKVGKETIEYLSQQEIKQTSVQKEFLKKIKNKYTNHPSNTPKSLCSKKSEHSDLLMDAALMLPFTLPNNVDMLATYDSKIAETDIKKQKHFIPVIPSDFMDILNKRTNDNNNNNESQQTKTSYSEELNNEILNDKAAENNVS